MIEAVARVAAELGVSSAEVALAWVRSRPAVTSTLIGARTLEQLRSNLASLEVTLAPEQLAALERAVGTITRLPRRHPRRARADARLRRHDRGRRRAPDVAGAARELSPLLSSPWEPRPGESNAVRDGHLVVSAPSLASSCCWARHERTVFSVLGNLDAALQQHATV